MPGLELHQWETGWGPDVVKQEPGAEAALEGRPRLRPGARGSDDGEQHGALSSQEHGDGIRVKRYKDKVVLMSWREVL